jgi:hypothetical protein
VHHSPIYITTHCNKLQHAATHAATKQQAPKVVDFREMHTSLSNVNCNTPQHTLTYTVTRCNTLQHAATLCNNTLRHSATHCNTKQALKGVNFRETRASLKFSQNCEFRLFQRPDDAIHRGYDKMTEWDMVCCIVLRWLLQSALLCVL